MEFGRLQIGTEFFLDEPRVLCKKVGPFSYLTKHMTMGIIGKNERVWPVFMLN